jgi:hypothetical protein
MGSRNEAEIVQVDDGIDRGTVSNDLVVKDQHGQAVDERPRTQG